LGYGLNITRLFDAVQASREKMEPFRRKRLEAIRQFVGHHYSDGGANARVPLNQIRLAVQIYLRLLVSQDPKALVTSPHPQLLAVADQMQQWMNWRVEGMQLAESLRLVACDAVFLLGIMKVGVTAGEPFEWEGQTHLLNEPYADPVDVEDFVWDMSAKLRSQVGFMGHRYRMPLDVAQADETFDPEARAALKAVQYPTTNESGDERVKNVEDDSQATWTDGYCDYVELWEIYLPREQLVVTYAAEPLGGAPNKPLRVVPWFGPERGPYHFLSFLDAPSLLMPVSPVSDMIDLHDLINRVGRKLGNQSDRQKTVLAVAAGSEKDGQAICDAADGMMVSVQRPEAVKEIRFGGADGQQAAFLMQLVDQFNRHQGNLELVGGISQQAETLGQEQLLQANSSAQLQDMQGRMLAFTKGVMKALAWYWWNDPHRTYEVQRTLEGVDGVAVSHITPQQRRGNFLRLNFDVNPFSLTAKTPAQQLALIDQLMMQVLLPGAQALGQQGIGINFAAYLRRKARLSDMPYLEELVTFQEPQPADGPQAEPPRMPQTSNRHYTRHNVSAPQNAGTKAAQMRALVSSGAGQGGGFEVGA
jgi:hypothetical protein